MQTVLRTRSTEFVANKNWKRLPADNHRYPCAVYSDGSSVLIINAVATCFGGPYDHGDAGDTASGIRTDGVGGVVGCALPMPAARGCRGTPIAQLPWKTPVHVQMGGWEVVVPVIDDGPSGGLKSEAIIDLTVNTVQSLMGPERIDPHSSNWWQGRVNVLIPNVGKYLADYWPAGVAHPENDDLRRGTRNG